ncbi:MAG: hypothetical protein RJA07_1076 [Bacteroidota bacterium]
MMLPKNISSNSFSKQIFANIKQNKRAVFAFWIIAVMLMIGLFAPFIANNQPYYIKVFNHSYYPIFTINNQIDFYDETENVKTIDCRQMDWKHLPFDAAIFPFIAYSPNSSDIINADYKSPNDEQLFKNTKGETEQIKFRFKHYLGTNKRGEDVCSGLIHGASISLLVGVLSMLIAGFLGIAIGLLAGYFGNDRWQMKRGTMYFLLIAIVLAWFYSFQLRWFNLSDALAISTLFFLFQLLISVIIFVLIIFLFYFFAEKTISRISFFSTPVFIPIDSIIVRIIEVIVSLPVIVLIISIAAIAKPSFTNLILIIGLIQWTSIARFVRAEMLRIRNAEFMQAAEVMGVKPMQIIFRHALPNTISSALVSLSFGVAQAILIESSLSFLGIGLPVDTVSWGSLINAGCENFQAWWLVIFPGLCIFATVLSFNILGEALRDAMDVRMRR